MSNEKMDGSPLIREEAFKQLVPIVKIEHREKLLRAKLGERGNELYWQALFYHPEACRFWEKPMEEIQCIAGVIDLWECYLRLDTDGLTSEKFCGEIIELTKENSTAQKAKEACEEMKNVTKELLKDSNDQFSNSLRENVFSPGFILLNLIGYQSPTEEVNTLDTSHIHARLVALDAEIAVLNGVLNMDKENRSALVNEMTCGNPNFFNLQEKIVTKRIKKASIALQRLKNQRIDLARVWEDMIDENDEQKMFPAFSTEQMKWFRRNRQNGATYRDDERMQQLYEIASDPLYLKIKETMSDIEKAKPGTRQDSIALMSALLNKAQKEKFPVWLLESAHFLIKELAASEQHANITISPAPAGQGTTQWLRQTSSITPRQEEIYLKPVMSINYFKKQLNALEIKTKKNRRIVKRLLSPKKQERERLGLNQELNTLEKQMTDYVTKYFGKSNVGYSKLKMNIRNLRKKLR